MVNNTVFTSRTYRLWKISDLEGACEDFGHVATYLGGHPQNADNYVLDAEHVFEKGRPERVCGNTVKMISESRLAEYFQIHGDFSTHYGLFETCGTDAFRRQTSNENGGASCC